MTRSEHKYQKAIKMLAYEYCKAQAMAFVRKPMAYALYQVWKWFDGNEKSRIAEGSEADADISMVVGEKKKDKEKV